MLRTRRLGVGSYSLGKTCGRQCGQNDFLVRRREYPVFCIMVTWRKTVSLHLCEGLDGYFFYLEKARRAFRDLLKMPT